MDLAQAQPNSSDSASTYFKLLRCSTFHNDRAIELQNKTENYFDDSKGYLVYQLSSVVTST
jgi:hypothetical protein